MLDVESEARRLYDESDDAGLFRLAEDAWAAPGPSGTGVGEACRFAFIRAHQAGKALDAHVFRARALTAATLSGAKHTVAGMLLPHVFGLLELARDLDGAGRSRAAEAARGIVENLRLLAEPTSAWKSTFERLYHDKAAVTFVLQATDASGRLSAGGAALLSRAEASLLEAERVAGDARAALKVRGNLALVRYLLAQDDESRLERARETDEVAREAERIGANDVRDWATKNGLVMHRCQHTGWVPYEVL